MIFRFLRLHLGQMLVELLLALAVSALAIVAIVGVTTRSISNAGFSKKQSTATTFASQAMEWIRSEKNANWAAFYLRAGSSYCLNNLVWSAALPCDKVLDGNTFSREVTLTVLSPTAPQQVEASVLVKWTEISKDFSAKQTTVFTSY